MKQSSDAFFTGKAEKDEIGSIVVKKKNFKSLFFPISTSLQSTSSKPFVVKIYFNYRVV